MNPLTFGLVVLALVAAFCGFTLYERMHEGRCTLHGSGGWRRGGGLDCTYPAGTFPANHQITKAREPRSW